MGSSVSAVPEVVASTPQGAADPREIDLALRRYDTVFRYFASENAMSWTKNQFFLAANAGLLAFSAARFPKDTYWMSLLLPIVVSLVGLAFSTTWVLVLRKTSVNVDRWKAGACQRF